MTARPRAFRPRLRFRLRTLMVIVGVCAIVFWGSRIAYTWYNSVSLADAVADFNARASENRVGKHEPPLTVNEVVASIEAQLPTLNADEQVKAIYSNIVEWRRMPRDADLHFIPAYTSVEGLTQKVWWINLNVMTSETTGYGLRVRQTDDPVAGQGDDPVPVVLQFSTPTNPAAPAAPNSQ